MSKDDELLITSSDESAEKGTDDTKQKNKMFIFLLVVVVAAFLYKNIWTSEDTGKSVDKKSSAIAINPMKAKEQEEAEERARENMQSLSIDVTTKETAIAAIDRRLTQLSRDVEKSVQRMVNTEQTVAKNFKQFENRIEQRIVKIVDLIETQAYNNALEQRHGIGGGANPDRDYMPAVTDYPPVPGESNTSTADSANSGLEGTALDPGKPKKPRSKYGDNYFVLAKPGAPGTSTPVDLDQSNPFSEKGISEQSNTPSGTGNQQASTTGSDGEDEDENTKEETVPAFSFVPVTLLHGVDCPIGASLPGQGASSLTSPVPVVMPIKGLFKGPNGRIVDIGKAHILGMCSGLSNRERAVIKVERVSYWDAKGDAQYLDVNGYIIDPRDNNLNVAGIEISSAASDIAIASGAAAIQAIGTTVRASEFTNVVSDDGTSVSSITGELGKASAGAAFAASAEQISQYWLNKAASNIDVIHVPGGITVNLITVEPFTVKKAYDFGEDHYDSDVLL